MIRPPYKFQQTMVPFLFKWRELDFGYPQHVSPYQDVPDLFVQVVPNGFGTIHGMFHLLSKLFTRRFLEDGAGVKHFEGYARIVDPHTVEAGSQCMFSGIHTPNKGSQLDPPNLRSLAPPQTPHHENLMDTSPFFFSGIHPFRKPSKTQGKQPVFEKNDG